MEAAVIQQEQEKVFYLRRSRPFTLAEVRAILPTVLRVTARFHKMADKLAEAYERAKKDAAQQSCIDRKFQAVLETWSAQMAALGGIAKGPWLVDFDRGDLHYFCWHYPELDALYYHSADEGFEQRKPLNPKLH